MSRQHFRHVRQLADPRRRLEGALFDVPAAEPQLVGLHIPAPAPAVRTVHEQHLADEARIRGTVGPRRVFLGVSDPVLVPGGRAIHLHAGHRAGQLAVEVHAELRRGRAERALHAIAFGVVHLAEPPILQPRQQRDEQQHDACQERDTGEAAPEGRHRGESSTQKTAEMPGESAFNIVNNLFAHA